MISHRVIKIPIFEQSLLVIFGEKESAVQILQGYETSAKGMINKEDADKLLSNANYNGLFNYSMKYDCYILWMPTVPYTIREYGTLVHECQHFIFTMLQNIGITHDNSSDEVYSYLLSYVYESIDCFIDEIQKNIENK